MTERASPFRAAPVAASILSGLLAAAAVFASQAALGLAEFAPLAQLWTLWALMNQIIPFIYVSEKQKLRKNYCPCKEHPVWILARSANMFCFV